MKFTELIKLTSLKLLAIFGYITFLAGIYIITCTHNHYYCLNQVGEYTYKNLSQKGDYEIIILLFGAACLIIHLILLLYLICEIIIKKNYVSIQNNKNYNNIYKVSFYIGLALNIVPYIISRFFEILFTELAILTGIF